MPPVSLRIKILLTSGQMYYAAEKKKCDETSSFGLTVVRHPNA